MFESIRVAAKKHWKSILAAVVVVILIVLIMRMAKKQGFEFDLPYDVDLRQPDAAEDPELNNAFDHMEYIQDTSLTRETFEGHNEHVTDSMKWMAGAAHMAVLDHDDNIVPWTGLRRPKNNIKIGADARTVPSQYNDQLSKGKDVFF
jgi:hypothetical protein